MMQRRQQYLIGGLVLAVLAWPAMGWIHAIVFEPFISRGTTIADLSKSVQDKEAQHLLLLRAQKSLKEFKSSCLPPDPGKSKQPTAFNAQRLYVEWLTDLGQLCGFESLKVTAGSTTPRAGVYIAVVGKVDAEARYEQLVKFLDLFYRTNLLHRITSLHVSTKVFEGDPTLKVTFDAEGLALIDSKSRRTLFPQTMLTSPLSEDGTTITVSDAEEFPKEPNFRVQIKGEFLNVTSIDDMSWTVERAVERTHADAYIEGMNVDLVRMNPNHVDRTLDEFRKLISSNIFAKPAPPYQLQLGPLGEKTFTRGRPNDFTIAVRGFDTFKGKPEFSIVGSAPTGLKLDKSGKLSWRPGEDVAVGKYPVKFQVRHASATDGVLTETVTIRVREPNNPARLVAVPKVFLNQPWTYRPEVVEPESPSTRYTWKLGDKAPKGMTIDDKTGELKWTPGDEIEIGNLSVALVATDNDTPPQSTTLNLKLDVQDDAAQFTRLTGIFALGDKKRIFLTDQSTDKKTELHEGDEFSVSDLSGTIKRIGGKSVLIMLGSHEVRWEAGKSLREVQQSIKEVAAGSYD